MHFGDKFTSERIGHPHPQLTRGVPETPAPALSTQSDSIFYSHRLIIHLRASLAVLGQSAPTAECRGQDLRAACKEKWLSKQLCVPTKCNPRSAYNVGDLVYALKHRLNHRWTAAIITKPQDGNICDVKTGKGI
ncbi:hypothetical protein ACTXT7_017630 [Hymenolepis weldensis]